MCVAAQPKCCPFPQTGDHLLRKIGAVALEAAQHVGGAEEKIAMTAVKAKTPIISGLNVAAASC